MASGFETRTGGRDTFASQGPAPQRIGRGELSGTHRDVQLIGGNTQGGTDVQITAPGPMAQDVGAFLQKAAEPYLQRKQQERFFQGMARAQAGESIEELSRSHKSLVGQVFGPTAFEQGAQMFHAVKRVDEWQAGIMDPANMDKWVRMTPEEQGKALSEHSLAMMGDDPFVNQLVQKEIIQRSGPMLDTINKARFKFQQQTFHDTHYEALNGAADNLQRLGEAASKVNDPNDPNGMASVETAVDNMTELLHPPAGMDADTFKGTIKDFLSGATQRGNFYAYNAAVSRGALNLLSSDDQDKVLAAYDRWSKVGLAQAKGNHVQDMLKLYEQMQKRQITPLQYTAGIDAVNHKISNETGIQERAYDTEALVAAGKDGINMIAADMRRQEGWDHDDKVRTRERALDAADEDADNARKAANARTAWTGGEMNTYTNTGGDTVAANVTAIELYQQRDWGKLSLSFNKGLYINKPLANTIQAKLTSAGGTAYTAEAKEAYNVWKEWSRKDLGAAIAYYGPHAARLLTMDRMVGSGEVESQAYLFAFAETDIGKYSPTGLSGHELKEAKEYVEAAVDGKNSSWFERTFGNAAKAMSPSARELIVNETFREVGVLKRAGSHMPPEKLAEVAAGKAFANGHMEFHGGGLAWVNPPNAPRLPGIVKMNDETFRDTLRTVVDNRLRASGFTDGVDGDYDIQRIGNNLMVWTGTGVIMKITPQDISAERKTHAIAKTQQQDKTAGVRRPGETVAQFNERTKHRGPTKSLLELGKDILFGD